MYDGETARYKLRSEPCVRSSGRWDHYKTKQTSAYKKKKLISTLLSLCKDKVHPLALCSSPCSLLIMIVMFCCSGVAVGFSNHDLQFIASELGLTRKGALEPST